LDALDDAQWDGVDDTPRACVIYIIINIITRLAMVITAVILKAEQGRPQGLKMWPHNRWGADRA